MRLHTKKKKRQEFAPLPFQEPIVREHVKAFRSGEKVRIDGSDMGAGKTYITCFTAKRLGLPMFVVCPKTAIKVWEKATKEVGNEVLCIKNYEALTRGSNKDWGHFPVRDKALEEYAQRIIVWEAEYAKWCLDNPTATGEEKLNRQKFQPKRPIVEDNRWEWNLPDHVLLVFDEAHRAKGECSLNAELMIAAARQELRIFALSATSACDPADMRALGYLLGLHQLEDFHLWAINHGCIRNQFGQLCFVGGEDSLMQLHEEMYPDKGCRIRVDELPKGLFPETQISADAYDMGTDQRKINKVYDEMKDQLARWEAGMSTDKGANPLVIMLRARQKVELLKVPTFIEMAKDARKDGCRVCIFVSFKETIWALAEKLKTNCLYYGGNVSERQQWLDRFQANEEDYIVLNCAAGAESISMHDIHGKNPRYTIISPTWSAIKMHQCLGRVHRAGGKTPSIQRIVYAAGTIEEKVCSNVRRKLNNMTVLNDGDLIPDHMLEFLKPYKALLSKSEETEQ